MIEMGRHTWVEVDPTTLEGSPWTHLWRCSGCDGTMTRSESGPVPPDPDFWEGHPMRTCFGADRVSAQAANCRHSHFTHDGKDPPEAGRCYDCGVRMTRAAYMAHVMRGRVPMKESA